MTKLYRSIDETFIDLWNGVQRHADPLWVHELQIKLVELKPDYLQCTEEKMANVLLTQYWLRTIVWQLCSSRGLLNMLTASSMVLLSPNCIAMDLQITLQGFLQSAKLAHGNSLVSSVADHLRSSMHKSFPVCTWLAQSRPEAGG